MRDASGRYCPSAIAGVASALIAGALCVAAARAEPRVRPIRTVAATTRATEASTPVVAHLATPNAGEASLVIDAPRPIEIEAAYLADPKRIIIDCAGAAFASPSQPLAGAGPVSNWRFGLFVQGGSRIVLDLGEPAIVDRIDALPTPLGTRMVLTLKTVTEQRFAEAALDAVERRATGATKLRRAAPETPVAAAASPDASTAAVPPKLPLVVIDPGHGGVDNGAVSPGGDVEKALVLDIGLQLKRKLEESGKVRVEMTRDGDVFVPLPDRVRIARDKAAALFLSIHADTLVGEPAVRGATVYTLSEKASDASAARLAEKENKVDQIAGLDASDDKEEVSDILFDLARRETRQFSLGFAKGLMQKLSVATSVNKNPHRFAGFRVLKAPDVPSVLLEIGYLSNPDDAKLISSREWQERVTAAASEAIIRFVSGRGLNGAQSQGVEE